MAGTLVYDADCAFCTRSAAWLAARTDSAVAPWQSLDLPGVGLSEAQVSTAAYWLQEGRVPARGARAVAAALRSCRARRLRLLGRLIDLAPMRPLALVGYTLVARNRHRLPGGTAACRVEDS